MKITENKLRWFCEIGNEILVFADTYCMAKYKESGSLYITCFNLWSISFRLEWETGCRGCYDSHSLEFDIPFDLFMTDNWREVLQKEIDNARKKEEEQKRKLEEQARQAREQRDQLEYLRLKQKYEK